jgi:hypothetical protein
MTTSFSKDVLPLFRSGDVHCMAAYGVQLASADWMCDPAAQFGFPDYGNARQVFSALEEATMPPDGAWAADRLAIYQRWMSDGFKA